MVGEYSIQTSEIMTNILVEDKNMRILAGMKNGEVSDFHYTALLSTLLDW